MHPSTLRRTGALFLLLALTLTLAGCEMLKTEDMEQRVRAMLDMNVAGDREGSYALLFSSRTVSMSMGGGIGCWIKVFLLYVDCRRFPENGCYESFCSDILSHSFRVHNNERIRFSIKYAQRVNRPADSISP